MVIMYEATMASAADNQLVPRPRITADSTPSAAPNT